MAGPNRKDESRYSSLLILHQRSRHCLRQRSGLRTVEGGDVVRADGDAASGKRGLRSGRIADAGGCAGIAAGTVGSWQRGASGSGKAGGDSTEAGRSV